MTTRADLMRETGAFLASITISIAVAAIAKFGSAWLGAPTPDFANGWVAAVAFISAYRWLNGGAS